MNEMHLRLFATIRSVLSLSNETAMSKSVLGFSVLGITLSLMLLPHAFAEKDKEEEEYRGPVIGYKDSDCTGESKRFKSKNHLQRGNVLYWSWHPPDDESDCTNLLVEHGSVIYGKRLRRVIYTDYLSPSILGMVNMRRWRDSDWRSAMRDTQACWQRKARARNVAYGKGRYSLKLDWNLGASGEARIDWKKEPPKFDGIYINPQAIGYGATSADPKHWYYTDFVYTLIHETIHAERFFSGEYIRLRENSSTPHMVWEEREVQELAYNRYKAIYPNKEPPFSFKTVDELEKEMEETGWYDLSEEWARLKDSTDPKDVEEFRKVDADLMALAYQLMQGVDNDDYDMSEDRIDPC